MKMRIYGFSWVPDALPKNIPATLVFEQIERVSGCDYGDYIAAATPVGEWWAGVLLKVRNSRKITTLKTQGGVLVFTAEDLADGTSLAEPNFFIAHRSNGRGLYCHHYLSASLMGDFGYFCYHRFQEALKAICAQAIGDPDLSETERQKIRKQFKGKLQLEQILKPGAFDSHIKMLKRITKLEANLVAFEMKQSVFRPLTDSARRRKVVLGFDPHADPRMLAHYIAQARQQGEFEKATVTGLDPTGREAVYRTQHDNAIFGEFEYDNMIKSVSLRFDDLAGSIKNSSLTATLIDIAKEPKVRAALGIK